MLSDLYLYLDETGQLGLSSSPYFGLGQATFEGDMGSMAWEGTQLRFNLERNGVHLPKGFHAKNDKEPTREKVFDLIAKHAPRFDVTLLHKKYLPETTRLDIESDEIALYYLAWKKHFIYQARYLLRPFHRVFVVAASLSEHPKKQEAATTAIQEVLTKYPRLDITLCVWDNSTSWGLQVADYGLWVVQRDLTSGSCKHFKTISPLIASVYSPWEKEGTKKEYRPAAECKKRGRSISTCCSTGKINRRRSRANPTSSSPHTSQPPTKSTRTKYRTTHSKETTRSGPAFGAARCGRTTSRGQMTSKPRGTTSD